MYLIVWLALKSLTVEQLLEQDCQALLTSQG